MKKCYYFPTWVDISKDVAISCDEKSIYVQPANMFVGKGDAIIRLWHNDLVSCDVRYEDDAMSDHCLYMDKTHHTYTINGFKYEEDSLTPITSNTLRDAKRFTQSTPSDPILAKLCELTGAKMYGDYIVVNVSAKNEKVGDLFSYQEGRYITYSLIKLCDQYHDEQSLLVLKLFPCPSCWKDGLPLGNHRKDVFVCNIFEQYSLFLQEKENKWEEVRKVLDL